MTHSSQTSLSKLPQTHSYQTSYLNQFSMISEAIFPCSCHFPSNISDYPHGSAPPICSTVNLFSPLMTAFLSFCLLELLKRSISDGIIFDGEGFRCILCFVGMAGLGCRFRWRFKLSAFYVGLGCPIARLSSRKG